MNIDMLRFIVFCCISYITDRRYGQEMRHALKSQES